MHPSDSTSDGTRAIWLARAGLLLAGVGLLLPWERWDPLGEPRTENGLDHVAFVVILAITTAIVLFRFVRPVVCVAGVTLAAIALEEAVSLLMQGGLFVDVDPGAGVWLSALGGTVVALSAASRLALAVGLGPIVAVALWPGQTEIDEGSSTLWFDNGTLYSGFFSSGQIQEIDGGEARVALTAAGDLNPVRLQVASVIVQDGALYLAVTDADRVIRITPDGERTVLLTGPPRRGIERPEGDPIVRDGFIPRALAPAPDGGLYILSGNEVLHYRTGTLDVVTARLFSPDDMTVDDEGRLYVADTGNGRVVRVERDGTLRALIGTEAAPRCVQRGGDDPLALDPRRCLGVDALAVGDDGTLFVATRGVARVLALEEGKLRVVAGTGIRGSQNGRLGQVEALAVGAGGDLYVGETERVLRVAGKTPREPRPESSPACGAIARWSVASLQAAAIDTRDGAGLRQAIPRLEAAARRLAATAPDELAEDADEQAEDATELRVALEQVGYDAARLESERRGALIMIGIRDDQTAMAEYGERRCGLVGGLYALDRETTLRFCVTYQRAVDSTRAGSPERARAASTLPRSFLPRGGGEGAIEMLARRACANR